MATEEMRGIPFDSRKQLAEDGSMYEDREVFSADIAEYFGYLSSNGICIHEGDELGNQLKITAGTAGTVVFNPGTIKIQGRMGWMEDAVEKQAEAGGTKPRYDTAVIELNLSTAERRFIPKIIKGEESDSPVPPELTQTANIYQLGLANIYRTANSTALGTITDTRADVSRCGISKVAVPNVPDDVINLWASQYPGVVSLADILTKISTEGLPIPFGGTGATTSAAALTALGIYDHIVEEGETSDGINGYIKFANGLMFQWGSKGVQTGQGASTMKVDFPTAFKDTKYRFLALGNYNFLEGITVSENIYTTGEQNRTTTYTTASIYKTGNPYWFAIDWFAIGRWK